MLQCTKKTWQLDKDSLLLKYQFHPFLVYAAQNEHNCSLQHSLFSCLNETGGVLLTILAPETAATAARNGQRSITLPRKGQPSIFFPIV